MPVFKKGQIVIPVSYKNSRQLFGINDHMKEMVRVKRKIRISSVHGYSVKAGGWTWSVKDLKHPRQLKSKKNKVKPEYFSTEMLME